MTPIISRPAPGQRKAPRSPRPHRRADLALGILLGLLIGFGAISAFVFLGSEGTLDAPKVPPSRKAGPHAVKPAAPIGARRAPVAADRR
jgi:hypothetical protein